MPYVAPRDVISPQDRIAAGSVIVIFDGGAFDDPNADGWSVATLTWDGHPCVGIRWNGDNADSPKGNPISIAHPVWFIVPAEIERAVLAFAMLRDRERST